MPTLPFFVAFAAASAAGSTTPVIGTGKDSFSLSSAVVLTVPQATSIAFTPFDIRKEASCMAYFVIIPADFVP